MVWFEDTDGGGGLPGPGFTYLGNGNTTTVGGGDTSVPAGTWFDVASDFVSGTSVSHVDVTFTWSDNRSGILYFDNIYFD